MNKRLTFLIAVLTAIFMQGQEFRELAVGRPFSVINLKSAEGTRLVKATWKQAPAKIVDYEFRAPGPSNDDAHKLYPTGMPVNTFAITPRAGAVNFDDSGWEKLDPESLEDRAGNGLLSFVWYRINVTIPDQLDGKSTMNSRVYFEIVMDDYAEVLVNGVLNKTFGDRGGQAIAGYNSRNRVLLTDNAHPGEQYQLAILGINGPLADLPENYIWVRSATLDFYDQKPVSPEWENVGSIQRFKPELDGVIAPHSKISKVADGFSFIEGPVWHPEGYLLFSDPNENVIYKYEPLTGNVSIYMTKSGYTGTDIGRYGQPGSNGLAIDSEGRLLADQHGNRRVVRFEKKGPQTIVSDNWEGKRLNSPNDIVLRSDDLVYFTDPPYGLPKFYEDPSKEIETQGVYAVINGKTELVASDLGGPNGIAFSPDERYLYVSNWDIRDIHNTKVIWRYEVQKDGRLINGKEFFNMNNTAGDEALDGLKVDHKGNVFSSAPGGVWVISPEGQLLGIIQAPERPANMAWGGKDGKTLYMTAHTGLYKIETNTGSTKKISKSIAVNQP